MFMWGCVFFMRKNCSALAHRFATSARWTARCSPRSLFSLALPALVRHARLFLARYSTYSLLNSSHSTHQFT